MDNLNIRQFRNAITTYINQTQLPMEVKLLVLKDITNQLEAEANRVVAMELEESKKQESEVVDNG